MKKTIAALLILSMTFPYAVADDDVRTLTVTGVGHIEMVPDQAHVTYQVTDEQPASLGQSKAIAKAMTANRQKVQADAAYIKSVIGQDGTVEIVPTVQPHQEYNDKTKKYELIGYKVTSTIRVTLQGQGAIDQKLSQLFDSSRIEADEISAPSFDLSDKTLAAAKLQAYKAAVQNGVDTAQAQLEQGEVLGPALQRGYHVTVPPVHDRFEARAAAAPMMGAGPGSAATQAVVESGKVAVDATINFLFSVTGMPSRLAAQAAQAVASGGSSSGKKVPPPTGCSDKGC